MSQKLLETNFYYSAGSNAVPVNIVHFDYNYIRDAASKHFDVPAKFKEINVGIVISSTMDTTKFITVPLRDIYYGSAAKLSVLNLITDDIHFYNYTYQGIEKSDEMKYFEDRAKGLIDARGITINDDIDEEIKAVVIPTIERVRLPVDTSTALYQDLVEHLKKTDKDLDPKFVMDWHLNSKMNVEVITNENKKITDSNMDLVVAMQRNSEHIIQEVLKPISVLLKENFTKKSSFFSSLFGSSKSFKYSLEETDIIIRLLKQTIKVDVTKYEGISSMFDSMESNIKELTSHLENSVDALTMINEVLDPTSVETYQHGLTLNLLSKIQFSLNTSLQRAMMVKRNFIYQLHTLKELQNVAVPSVISGLQASINQNIDPSTILIIENIIKVIDTDKSE